MAHSLELRRIGPDDAAVLSSLWATTFQQAYAGVHAPADIEAYCAANFTLDHARETLSDSKHSCTIAYRDAAPRGLTVIKHAPCPVPLPASSAELKQIYILAEEYGSGLARLLFDDALDLIRALPAEQVWLAVSDHNLRAQRFYAKLGCARVGVGPVFNVGADRVVSSLFSRPV